MPQVEQAKMLKLNTPLSLASKQDLIQEIRSNRVIIKEKEALIQRINNTIKAESVSLSKELQVSSLCEQFYL